jgi:hypothetical protein
MEALHTISVSLGLKIPQLHLLSLSRYGIPDHAPSAFLSLDLLHKFPLVCYIEYVSCNWSASRLLQCRFIAYFSEQLSFHLTGYWRVILHIASYYLYHTSATNFSFLKRGMA